MSYVADAKYAATRAALRPSRCSDAGSVSFVSFGKQSSDEPLVHVLSVSVADAQLVSCLDEEQKGKTRR